jgi:predicted lipoprotein with Yx(FWY)xxD motif
MRTWQSTAGTVLATIAGIVALSFGAPVVLAGTAGAATHTEGAAASTKVEVKVEKVGTYGRVLADQKGLALYYNTTDKPSKHWACTGSCLSHWPALVLPKGQKAAVAGPGVSGLGTVKSPAGVQVTWHGKPLYSFAGDKAGDVTGQGLHGVWFIASLSAAGSNTTTTTKSYGGY